MIGSLLVQIVEVVADLLVLIVIVDSILTYFLSPYHPLRSALDRIVQPMLAPLRRFIRPVGMLDFTPLVLIVLIQVLSYVLKIMIVSL
jgi:YggT family protein